MSMHRQRTSPQQDGNEVNNVLIEEIVDVAKTLKSIYVESSNVDAVLHEESLSNDNV